MPHFKKSLEEVHATVDTTAKKGFFKKLFAFMGPAYLVSVGYMDPGNWATDIAGGSQFGYTLIWVLLMSNIMAVVLQSLSARLGIVRGRDLAQACKETYPPFVNISLYVMAEIAIIATDLAEVLGMAIGLQLLFDIPLLWGVALTFLDTFILLFLINKGMRKMEAFILALVVIIGSAFFIEMILAKPHIPDLMAGFIPSIPNNTALYIAIGIIGATVMPHNLYLHSSLVQSRKFAKTKIKIKEAIKFNLIDSVIALNLAFFVNAAILVLAAATFYKVGMYHVEEIQDAHKLLAPLLGTKLAPILFAIALIAAGQSSTLTGTLAGQIIMEGFINFRIQPWARRMITRLLAIIPAVIVLIYFGESYTGKLLILSQVVLSLQLGFAVIPLIHFVSDKKFMRDFTIKRPTKIASWIIALIIIALNGKLVFSEINDWVGSSTHPTLLLLMMIPFLLLILGILLYISFVPLIKKSSEQQSRKFHTNITAPSNLQKQEFNKITLALDFSEIDNSVIQHALSLGNKETQYQFIHIVESATAIVYGEDTDDYETTSDKKVLENYASSIQKLGYNVTSNLGYGSPKKAIPELVNSFNSDVLVLGSHGHKWFKDLIFGTTINAVRHSVKIPVLIVRND
ncbi:MAG: Nramp family divalent metal transporter [Flavobacteriaceae bacterium]